MDNYFVLSEESVNVKWRDFNEELMQLYVCTFIKIELFKREEKSCLSLDVMTLPLKRAPRLRFLTECCPMTFLSNLS